MKNFAPRGKKAAETLDKPAAFVYNIYVRGYGGTSHAVAKQETQFLVISSFAACGQTRARQTKYAGMAELADAAVLGAATYVCRFKSCYPQCVTARDDFYIRSLRSLLFYSSNFG